MVREEVAKLIRWPYVIAMFGALNPLFMLPQLYSILDTHITEGISVPTLLILICVQIAFGFHGFFQRDTTLMFTNIAAGFVSILVLIAVFWFRYV